MYMYIGGKEHIMVSFTYSLYLHLACESYNLLRQIWDMKIHHPLSHSPGVQWTKNEMTVGHEKIHYFGNKVKHTSETWISTSV